MIQKKEKDKKYREKRKMGKTPEPLEDNPDLDWTENRPVFVIQKHNASTLHYDFRIEVEGVLKSWVIPKGPSTDPSEKRLAVPSEDHPLAYANFEGVIPEDQYGEGTVLIWDRGSFRNLKEEENDTPPSLSQQIDEGHVTIWLEGEKIAGGYALIRTGKGDQKRWLMIKMNDEKADARRNPTSTEPKSVKSGRSLEEIHQEEGLESDD